MDCYTYIRISVYSSRTDEHTPRSHHNPLHVHRQQLPQRIERSPVQSLGPGGLRSGELRQFPQAADSTRTPCKPCTTSASRPKAFTAKTSSAFADSPPDIVITVCDKAAGETCPVYFGPALKSHWGLADPSDVQGTEQQVQAAFANTVATIKQRFATSSPWTYKPVDAELKAELDRIGALG